MKNILSLSEPELIIDYKNYGYTCVYLDIIDNNYFYFCYYKDFFWISRIESLISLQANYMQISERIPTYYSSSLEEKYIKCYDQVMPAVRKYLSLL